MFLKMREWWQRQSLSGVSPVRLALAGVLVVAAACVLIRDFSGTSADGAVLHDGTAAALDATTAPAATSAPLDATTAPAATAPDERETEPATAAEPPRPAPPTAASGSPAEPSSEPDWGTLFVQLMAREDAKAAAAGGDAGVMAGITAQLSGFHVRGVVHDATTSLALVNSRLVHVGDTLEGTAFTVIAILPDRLQLRFPGCSTPVDLPLEPMHSSAGRP